MIISRKDVTLIQLWFRILEFRIPTEERLSRQNTNVLVALCCLQLRFLRQSPWKEWDLISFTTFSLLIVYCRGQGDQDITRFNKPVFKLFKEAKIISPNSKLHNVIPRMTPRGKLLDERPDKSVPTETLCDLMRMILTMNNFIQQHGTAMGTRMTPAFANLFMGEFERKALEGYVDKPFLWLRYIYDILMVWTHGNEKLESFIAYWLKQHPSHNQILFTSIPFLDVKILLENGKIETDLYCKPTDKHQYLLHSSSHSYHTKKSIPYSLALR